LNRFGLKQATGGDEMPLFGPAGNPQAFYDAGFKSSVQMPAWLAAQNLTAYEYQCGRGVNIGAEHAVLLGEAAKAADIQLSLHAPYYINLASHDPEKQQKTIGYILESLEAARQMAARRVILHPGSAAQSASRAEALELAVELFKRVIGLADEKGLLQNCTLCPEVMGKYNQLGDLGEVITLCRLDDRLIPCVDFGHFNARTQGGLRSTEDYRMICREIAGKLGFERLRQLHVHFSRIEFTAGGEKMHHRLADRQYGPDFEPLADVMAEMAIDPVVICESDGTQAADAVEMREMFEARCKNHPL
jgi:deoxyribonuclease-4